MSALDPWIVGPDAADANWRAWIAAGCPNAEPTRVIELDRYPGESVEYDGDVDGRRADEAAALWENRYEAQAGWAS